MQSFSFRIRKEEDKKRSRDLSCSRDLLCIQTEQSSDSRESRVTATSFTLTKLVSVTWRTAFSALFSFVAARRCFCWCVIGNISRILANPAYP